MKLDRSIYRAHDALNASLLKTVLSHSYWHAIQKKDPTPAMKFGTASHTMILEGVEQFGQEYDVFEGDRRTKAGKEAYQSILDRGVEPMPKKDVDAILAMRDSCLSDKRVRHYLEHKDRMVEASYSFPSPYVDGLECKSQIDLYADGFLVDLKTIADITKARRQFFDMHYDLQLAFYRDCLVAQGLEVKAVYVLFVETQAPHQAAFFRVSDDVLKYGEHKIQKALAKYFDQATRPVPDVIDGTLELPSWVDRETIDKSPFSAVS